jgi:hypothetical protein
VLADETIGPIARAHGKPRRRRSCSAGTRNLNSGCPDGLNRAAAQTLLTVSQT